MDFTYFWSTQGVYVIELFYQDNHETAINFLSLISLRLMTYLTSEGINSLQV